MNCPSCSGKLNTVSVIGFDDSLRCDKCGGVFVANWVVNNLAEGKEVNIQPTNGKLDGGGSLKCPLDEALLSGVSEEVAPHGVRSMKCSVCGGWWFELNGIFDFAKAYKLKSDYLQTWKKTDFMNLAWPALVLVLLVGGVFGGVYLVRQEQQTTIIASYGIFDLTIIKLDRDEIEVRFKSKNRVDYVEYRMVGELDWMLVPVKTEGEYLVAGVDAMETGQYEIKVGDTTRVIEIY